MRFTLGRWLACLMEAPFLETRDRKRAIRSLFEWREEYQSGPRFVLSLRGVLNGLLARVQGRIDINEDLRLTVIMFDR